MMALSERQFLSLPPLPDKIDPLCMLSLLPSLGYKAVVEDGMSSEETSRTVLYFEHQHILVFPPSTDNPLASSAKLLGIEAHVDRALQYINTNNVLAEKAMLIFPMYEEWQPRGSWSPRNHWVLLVYNKTERQLYLLDSKGPNLSTALYGQLLVHMQGAAKKALDKLNCYVSKPCMTIYSSKQEINDSNSSGYWIAYSLHRFNQSADLATLQLDLKDKKLASICEIIETARKLSADSIEEDESLNRQVDETPHMLIETVDIDTIERQDYAQPRVVASPTTSDSNTGSMLNDPTQISAPYTGPRLSSRTQSHRFKLNVYSALIYGGVTVLALALVCLSTVSIVPTMISTAVFGVGMGMVFGGLLGKCGLFQEGDADSSQRTGALGYGVRRPLA